MENITMKEFFKRELEAKKQGIWFIFSGFVEGVYIEINQYRGNDIYQKSLRVCGGITNYAAGHTLKSVGEFKKQIADILRAELQKILNGE